MTDPKIATRVLSVRTRLPDEPGRQPNRWTETPLRSSDDVAQIIIDLLPHRMVEQIWDRLDHHLADTDEPADPDALP
jgi:hypothetical protein